MLYKYRYKGKEERLVPRVGIVPPEGIVELEESITHPLFEEVEVVMYEGEDKADGPIKKGVPVKIYVESKADKKARKDAEKKIEELEEEAQQEEEEEKVEKVSNK